ncbi:MAG: M20/M25/M40 family metallo-hydrolase [candidate division Zixibacteria bacterium]|nr:M20/M25/M40 family metallo-hydrolase [candidate division Zixibacteria bacterium]
MTRLTKIFIALAIVTTLGTGVVSLAPEAVWLDQNDRSLLERAHTVKSAGIDQRAIQEHIISLGKNDNRVMEHLYHLTNRIGPRPAGSENFQIASEWARDRFADFGLKNVHLERCAEVSIPGFLASIARLVRAPTPVFNVIADIPGTELPDEYVIVGAHIDSHDAGTGAADNGTGVAAAVEAARILMESGAEPRRTIRFILFGGEELGKVGSQAYVADHPDLMPRVSAMLNMDQGGDHISGIYATDDLTEDFEKVFAPVRSLSSRMPFAIQRVEHLTQIIADCCGGAGTSDHGPFFEAGVPAFNWLQKGQNPVQYRPHTKYDTYEYINPQYQKHSATVIALAAYGMANLDHMLSRENLMDPSGSQAQGSPCCPPGSGLSPRCPATGSSCCPSGTGSAKASKDIGSACCPSVSSLSLECEGKRSGCCPSGADSPATSKFRDKGSTCCPAGSGSSTTFRSRGKGNTCCPSASGSTSL